MRKANARPAGYLIAHVSTGHEEDTVLHLCHQVTAMTALVKENSMEGSVVDMDGILMMVGSDQVEIEAMSRAAVKKGRKIRSAERKTEADERGEGRQ